MIQLLPFGYPRTHFYEGIKIKYDNLYEIGQGGPEVGSLLFDGINHFPKYFFGGPLLINANYIYIPVFIRTWIGTSFKLGKINLNLLSIELIGKKEHLILVDKIQNISLFYFTDINNSIVKVIQIE